ncbi:5'-nucleotidase, lipoprotein e(P4) family [Flavobacterium sp. HSC-61S13]|uniref:5'-nucleotidase, lipoprotein e(P4) family n=1 Tax=Flavobacterium sp. HSC-61S13 TaxID=2910963 RepID=UPI00209FD50A|nr:5'-nucleotidase, lipoprotein e(P4) family [Flavobacterium sp. HSC-61S13]MCP1996246.1 5'-nucleotidase (lipoprotein e(P4) family) [Flavobacterium sp. HSC-61S13]
MFQTKIYVAALSLALFSSCQVAQVKSTTNSNPRIVNDIELNGKVYSAVFHQRAAEYQALCQQAFNVATIHLDVVLQQKHAKPIAIVTDIDETFLDNSPYAVEMAKRGQVFDEASWLEWTSKGNAKPLLGSQDFFNYAASKGVTIFYITNRNQNDKAGTIANLKKYNYPMADEQHVIVRQSDSSKETRRLKVSETHEIVMLLGDNLSDFSNAFDKKTEEQRSEAVRNNAREFGRKFIVLPNVNYGDWESALLDYKRDWTPQQKDSIYNSKLIGF